MLKIFEITLGMPPEVRVNSSMGSVFQGALMELLSEDVAIELHQAGLRPYTQTVYFDREIRMPVWRLSCLNDFAETEIVKPLLEKNELFLKQKNYSVKLLTKKQIHATTFEQLTDVYFQAEEVPYGVDLTFRTVTSFKRDGAYVIMPELYLILQSLLNKWNFCSPDIKLQEQNLERHLAESCRIVQYNLHTEPFYIENKKIYGFAGKMRNLFHGNDSVKRVLALLFGFAPYAGVGIKTAIGMGAVQSTIIFRRDCQE